LTGSRISRELLPALLACASALIGSHALFALDPNRDISQYTLTRWSVSDAAFPGGGVNAIAQTNDGYLWIGAENGLVRFDGFGFRLFTHANTPSLPAGHILGLSVESDGHLWVRMESPYLLRYERGTFEQVYPLQFDRPGVSAMALDQKGRILIAEADDLVRYSEREHSRTVVAKLGGLAISIAEAAGGAVFIGMRDLGLLYQRGDARTSLGGLPDQKINALLAAGGQNVWIGTDGGLARWDGTAVTQQGVPSELKRTQILAIARDHDSNLWVSTPRGVARLDARGNLSPMLTLDGAGPIHSIFEDREGNLWLGGAQALVQLRDSLFLTYPASDGGSVYADDTGASWLGPASGGLILTRGTIRQSITLNGLAADVVYSISGGAGEVWWAGGTVDLHDCGVKPMAPGAHRALRPAKVLPLEESTPFIERVMAPCGPERSVAALAGFRTAGSPHSLLLTG
jgi:ligand-binding sensor domain-containing protein